MLAIILIDGPDDAEVEAVILRHLALIPDDGASLLLLGHLRARRPEALSSGTSPWRSGYGPVSVGPSGRCAGCTGSRR
jgi:hypothetical protein